MIDLKYYHHNVVISCARMFLSPYMRGPTKQDIDHIYAHISCVGLTEIFAQKRRKTSIFAAHFTSCWRQRRIHASVTDTTAYDIRYSCNKMLMWRYLKQIMQCHVEKFKCKTICDWLIYLYSNIPVVRYFSFSWCSILIYSKQ